MRYIVIGFAFLSLATLTWMVQITPQREKRYHELVAESAASRGGTDFACAPKREGVSKRLYLRGTQNGYLYLSSSSSTIHIARHNKLFSLSETLGDVRALVNIGNYGPKIMHAREGTLSYDTPHIQLFGATLKSSLVDGVADHVECGTDGLTVHGNVHLDSAYGELVADHATLNREGNDIYLHNNVCMKRPEGNMACQTVHIDRLASAAYLNGDVTLSKDEGSVRADLGRIDYHTGEKGVDIETITLMRSVEINDVASDRYALADQLQLFPRENRLTIEADPYVLFYDRQSETELAAKQLKASWGEDESVSVQGVGHVRFKFYTTELERLKGRFKLDD